MTKTDTALTEPQKLLIKHISATLFFYFFTVFLFRVPVNPGYGVSYTSFFALISIGIYYLSTADKKYGPEMWRDKKFLKIVLAVGFSYVFYSVIGSSLFFTQDRFNTIGKTTKVENAQDLTNTQNYFKEVDVRTVDLQMAQAKAKRVLGEQFEGRNISSQFELGKGSVILVKGIQQWVASGLRGYDLHFEINDQGTPFYVGGIYKTQSFLSGIYVDKAIVINAVTGKVDTYAVGEQPDWVDYVISERRAEEYLTWNGVYEKGFWNAFIWGENLEATTGAGLWSVVVNSKQYFYTGMTSTNQSDNSLISVRLFDPRNNEQIVFSNFSGLMDETGALDSIDSALGADSQRWNAVLPQIKEVNGEYYYFASIISQTGIFQKYGAVDASNPSKVFLEGNLKGLERKILLGGDSNDVKSDETIIVNKQDYLKMKSLIKQLQKLID